MGLKESGLRGSLRNVSVGIDAIPDEEDLHARYDFREYDATSTSDFDDLSGNGRDLINGSITDVSESINGNQAANLDGSGDGVRSDSFSDILPATFATVLRVDGSAEDAHTITQTNDSEFAAIEWQGGDNETEWRISRGESFVADGTSINAKLITGYIESGSNDVLRVDQQEFSGDGGGLDWNIHELGINTLSDRNFEGAIGAHLVWNGDKRDIIDDIESYLIDEFDLEL